MKRTPYTKVLKDCFTKGKPVALQLKLPGENGQPALIIGKITAIDEFEADGLCNVIVFQGPVVQSKEHPEKPPARQDSFVAEDQIALVHVFEEQLVQLAPSGLVK